MKHLWRLVCRLQVFPHDSMRRFPLRGKCCRWARTPTEDVFLHGYSQTARDKERQHQTPIPVLSILPSAREVSERHYAYDTARVHYFFFNLSPQVQAGMPSANVVLTHNS